MRSVLYSAETSGVGILRYKPSQKKSPLASKHPTPSPSLSLKILLVRTLPTKFLFPGFEGAERRCTVQFRIPKPLTSSSKLIRLHEFDDFSDTVLPQIYDIIGCSRVAEKPHLSYCFDKKPANTAEDLATQEDYEAIFTKAAGAPREVVVRLVDKVTASVQKYLELFSEQKNTVEEEIHLRFGQNQRN